MVSTDFIMVPIAILFVWAYMAFHIGAVPLASFGMLMIILSLPTAMIFYCPFIRYFSTLHNLAVFIVLGVGADDVFVFTDAWRRTNPTRPEAERPRGALE